MAPKTPNPSSTAKTTSNKKRKTTAKTTEVDLKTLKSLGHELLSSRSHINNLPILLTYVTPSTRPDYVVEVLLSLQSFFSPIVATLPSSGKCGDGSNDAEAIYRFWLRAKFDEFVEALLDVVCSSLCEDTLREVVLETIMEFVKLGSGGDFNSSLYHKLIENLVCSSVEVDFLLEFLASSYFKYSDVCYFTFIKVEKLCKTLESKNISGDKIAMAEDDSKTSLEGSIKKIHFILSRIPPLGDLTAAETWSSGPLLENASNQNSKREKNSENQKEDSTKSKISLRKMKLKFTKAWRSFLRLQLPLEVYKEVLVNLHETVIPYLSEPEMLCDFLTRSYDIGGVVSVMALSGLFFLMTKKNVDYPNFYEKLYALLTPSIFMAKHRARFFELVDACLKSPLLPAYYAAAFTKKLSKLCLEVPPSGALVIIALIHNLLLRHPSINFLVHQENNDETNLQGVDPFKYEESDLQKSNAMRSSLWEIDTLKDHYCPAVARFVSSLVNDLTVRSKSAEVKVSDFSSASYGTIFSEEMRRRVKKVPISFHKSQPTTLFSEVDFPGFAF